MLPILHLLPSNTIDLRNFLRKRLKLCAFKFAQARRLQIYLALISTVIHNCRMKIENLAIGSAVDCAAVASRVKVARAWRGFTRQKLSRLCGLKKWWVDRFEREPPKNPPLKKLRVVAEMLSVDYRWLITGEGGPK